MNHNANTIATIQNGNSKLFLVVTVGTSTIVAACALYSCYIQHKEHTMSKELHRVRMQKALG